MRTARNLFLIFLVATLISPQWVEGQVGVLRAARALLADGISSAPAYSWANDTDLGFWRIGADEQGHAGSLAIRGPRPWVDVRAYGAKGDGVTEDTAAIVSALAVLGSAGGIVYFPEGTYITNSKITAKNRVTLLGAGSYTTRILAGSSFPINTELISLGDGTVGQGFDVRVVRMQLDLNNISGSIGVKGNRAQEESGVFNSNITSFGDAGIVFEANTGAIVQVREVEIFAPAASSTATGIRLNNSDSMFILDHVAITRGAVGAAGTDAIKLIAGVLVANGIHVEGFEDGIEFNENSGGHVTGYIGSVPATLVTNDIHIVAANRGVTIVGLYSQQSTNMIKDDLSGRTITKSTSGGGVPLYVLGERRDLDGAAVRTIVTGLPGTNGSFNIPKLAGINGKLDLGKTADVKLHRELIGSRALVDAGVATPGNLLTLTLSAVGGEDSSLGVTLFYTVFTGAGGTHSIESGMVTAVFSQDSGAIRLSSVVKHGDTQNKDAGIATWSITFDFIISANVATLRATSETDINVNSSIHFRAIAQGGTRATSDVQLASGVTAGN